MSPGEAVRSVLKTNYAHFSGRASRSEYWWWWLVYFVAYLAVSFVLALSRSTALWAVFFLAGLLLIIPSLAVFVRRLHDIGRSGWWWLIAIHPFDRAPGAAHLHHPRQRERAEQMGPAALWQPLLQRRRTGRMGCPAAPGSAARLGTTTRAAAELADAALPAAARLGTAARPAAAELAAAAGAAADVGLSARPGPASRLGRPAAAGPAAGMGATAEAASPAAAVMGTAAAGSRTLRPAIAMTGSAGHDPSSEPPPDDHRGLPTIGVGLGCLLVVLAVVLGGMLITVITSLGR